MTYITATCVTCREWEYSTVHDSLSLITLEERAKTHTREHHGHVVTLRKCETIGTIVAGEKEE